MALLNAFLLMVRKKASSLMEPFKELRKAESKQLNSPTVKKIFSSLMELVSENSQTAVYAKLIPMDALKQPMEERLKTNDHVLDYFNYIQLL